MKTPQPSCDRGATKVSEGSGSSTQTSWQDTLWQRGWTEQ